MDELFEIQATLLKQLTTPIFWRRQFDELKESGPVTGIVGARGVGKTTFLIWQAMFLGAHRRKALYVSADHLFFLTHRLIDVVDFLFKHTEARSLLIDEIHKYPNWKMELKNIVDQYPSFQIFFSGSSMIDLMDGKYDLSRRVILYHLHGFSFREYLEFMENTQHPIYSLDQLVQHHLEIAQSMKTENILLKFGNYLRYGYYPFLYRHAKKSIGFQLLDNAVQMTIFEDIATLHSLKTESLLVIEQLYKFILSSSPGEFNASKLSRQLSKDFESITNFLRFLEQAGLIRFVYPAAAGNTALRKPAKLYPDNTNLMHAAHLHLLQDQFRGKVRETFFLGQAQNAGLDVFYSPICDFLVGAQYHFEIGGKQKKGKHPEQQVYILSDDRFVGSATHIPLYLMGFLY